MRRREGRDAHELVGLRVGKVCCVRVVHGGWDEDGMVAWRF